MVVCVCMCEGGVPEGRQLDMAIVETITRLLKYLMR